MSTNTDKAAEDSRAIDEASQACNALRLMRDALSKYGVHGTLYALADALRELGPKWRQPATDVEAVTGYAPNSIGGA